MFNLPFQLLLVNATSPVVAAPTVSPISTAIFLFVVETLSLTVGLIMVLAISLQIARGYFLRILRKFTLRLTADLWWFTYILLRNISILLVVLLGFVLFMPAVSLTYPVAVPFQPLAIVFYTYALVLIVTKNTDEVAIYDKALTALLAIGTGLYFIGTIAITETPTTLAVTPSTVAASNTNIWGLLYNTFSSVANPGMYIYSFYLTMLLQIIAVLYVLRWSFNPTGAKPMPNPNPNVKGSTEQQPAAQSAGDEHAI